MDYAQARAEEYTADALREHYRRTAIPPPDPLLDKEGGRKQSERGEVCEECGEPIPEARRRAQPTATHCVDCQAAIEKQRRIV